MTSVVVVRAVAAFSLFFLHRKHKAVDTEVCVRISLPVEVAVWLFRRVGSYYSLLQSHLLLPASADLWLLRLDVKTQQRHSSMLAERQLDYR